MLNKAIWAVPQGRHVVPQGVQDKIWLNKKGNKRQGFCRIMTICMSQHVPLYSQSENIHGVADHLVQPNPLCQMDIPLSNRLPTSTSLITATSDELVAHTISVATTQAIY